MASISSPAPRRAVFTGKQQVELQPFELNQPEENQVLVRVEKTLMSTGTENIVFNRLFAEGSHWDKWVKYPFFPGYCAVGTVQALGPAAKALAIGDRVALRCGHQSHALWREADCFALPAGLPFEQAVWFALAKIAFHGAKAADYKLGDDVVIIGAGPIGQMSTRWARASGAARIIVVDAVEKRLDLAKKGGATAVSLPIAEAKDAILASNGGSLPRVVIDSTGHPAVFAAALGLAKNFGTVVVLGDTGTPAGQHLTGDVVTRGLHIVGVHDGHNTPEWNQATITKLFFALAASGRFSLDGLNTHSFKPEECAEAYGIANRDRASTMGIIFDWS
jgi:2-desacetyl-2-hydroxyethyl bacteriochlorophyllide A dehydrogenase